MTEFLICFPVIVAVMAGALHLFRTEWNRTRCAYQVFLEAHAALRSTTHQSLRVQKTDLGVEARGQCGGSVETVRLPDLEKAQW